MRKWFAALTLLCLIFAPKAVQAQGEIKLSSLTIQLLPEEDKPSVLVIYDLQVAPGISLPVNLKFRLPAQAELNAVARAESGQLMVVPSQVNQAGGSQVVSFSVDNTDLIYRLEYYDPFEKNGIHRHFIYQWGGDYAVADLKVELKEPNGAINITTNPDLPDLSADQSGFEYRMLTTSDLSAGQTLNVTVDYDKQTDALNVSTGQPQPTGALGDSTPGSYPVTTYLPWILGGLGVILITGGALYYWQSGHGQHPSRRRHAPSSSEREKGESTKAIYCHQCGQRARPNDRFCRACGTRLQREQ
jgi:hypothetical protein